MLACGERIRMPGERERENFGLWRENKHACEKRRCLMVERATEIEGRVREGRERERERKEVEREGGGREKERERRRVREGAKGARGRGKRRANAADDSDDSDHRSRDPVYRTA